MPRLSRHTGQDQKFREGYLMQAILGSWSVMFLLVALSGGTSAQSKGRNQTLVVNGRVGEAGIVEMNGREYVDLEAFARIANGSLSFEGNRIILGVPAAPEAPAAAPVGDPAVTSGFSRDFMKAAITAMAQMREWASPLAYAIQNGYPITEEWVAGYREQAANELRLASAAASCDDDRKAVQLLSNEFEAVREWSNRLVEARKSMNTAKYAMSDSALRNDPLSQKIVTCAHFLAPMLGSGTFQDDPSCH